ncbi:histidine phosphatase family protein [Edaphobacter modestus]|uniref:Alpha-ribazole phosphatase/probable phosphoglycerate mutase n=1 Tax=Edaphobacter modestus TaxID=388466 RepID=A0A4Q7YR49_9BACT|nr:histidine phosphatase family protein [Edaphobacter modestus]RZU40157.1 alpha-ribazole phosphatase/probable phosphoglycerate mutase [Edaphobacter modestus]
MNDLLFIRHAETHMAGTFCGQSDPPVNAAGHRQIQKLAERLRTEPILTVFTSDLQRSVTTARALAESFAIPCITRPALREIDFGKWEGLTWEEIEKLDLTFAMKWLEAFPHMTPPDGESFEIFEARVMAETSYLLSQSESSLIAVVTHAGVMRAILRTLCGLDEKTTWTLTRPHCCTFRYAHHAHPDRRLQEVL